MKNKLLTIGAILGLALLTAVIAVVLSRPNESAASISNDQGYVATTTVVLNTYDGDGVVLLKNGYGQLGSVIVNATSSQSRFTLFDATTSDATKRSNSQSTSSITIADFSNISLAPAAFQFDVTLARGLLYVGSGTNGTTTITYK